MRRNKRETTYVIWLRLGQAQSLYYNSSNSSIHSCVLASASSCSPASSFGHARSCWVCLASRASLRLASRALLPQISWGGGKKDTVLLIRPVCTVLGCEFDLLRRKLHLNFGSQEGFDCCDGDSLAAALQREQLLIFE